MNTQYPNHPEQDKPRHGPQNGLAERKPSRVGGRRPHARNELYACAAEFKRRHPKATGADAWRHFTELAAGMSTLALSYSAALDVLEYAPDADRWGVRRIKRDSFLRRYRELPG